MSMSMAMPMSMYRPAAHHSSEPGRSSGGVSPGVGSVSARATWLAEPAEFLGPTCGLGGLLWITHKGITGSHGGCI